MKIIWATYIDHALSRTNTDTLYKVVSLEKEKREIQNQELFNFFFFFFLEEEKEEEEGNHHLCEIYSAASIIL